MDHPAVKGTFPCEVYYTAGAVAASVTEKGRVPEEPLTVEPKAPLDATEDDAHVTPMTELRSVKCNVSGGAVFE